MKKPKSFIFSNFEGAGAVYAKNKILLSVTWYKFVEWSYSIVIHMSNAYTLWPNNSTIKHSYQRNKYVRI